MAIPDFQTLMLPLMRFIEDGHEHLFRDAVDSIGKEFKLTEAEWAAMLPSGRAPLFYNRLAWTKTHLKRAGLLEQAKRGVIGITARGRQVLALAPKRIDISLLQKYPEYNQFRDAPADKGSELVQQDAAGTITPEEALERAHDSIRRDLVAEVLASTKR